jgi:chromosome segregation ATPase
MIASMEESLKCNAADHNQARSDMNAQIEQLSQALEICRRELIEARHLINDKSEKLLVLQSQMFSLKESCIQHSASELLLSDYRTSIGKLEEQVASLTGSLESARLSNASAEAKYWQDMKAMRETCDGRVRELESELEQKQCVFEERLAASQESICATRREYESEIATLNRYRMRLICIDIYNL